LSKLVGISVNGPRHNGCLSKRVFLVFLPLMIFPHACFIGVVSPTFVDALTYEKYE